jgi:magnesium chelatase family protein
MISRLYSGSIIGIETILVEIEVDLQPKVKGFEIVGLAGLAVKESVKRIEAAIMNSGFHFPGKQIVVNLAPAGIKKVGTLFDLPIALGILNNAYDFGNLSDTVLVGELALDGQLRRIPGSLSIAIKAKELGFKRILCPYDNASEMAIIKDIRIVPLKNLEEAVSYLTNCIEAPLFCETETACTASGVEKYLDMSEIKGQESAKRAIEIGAAGNHNLLMIGPPGTGKTMLAKRIPTILPPMDMEEALETTMIYSVVGLTNPENPLIRNRPFRNPHHTASDVSIVGGGKFPRPGEISLAHNGVLFLDEFQQFRSNVLQVLRQPMEERTVTISRAEGSVMFPAKFMLVAALNPSKKNTDIDQWSFKDMEAILNKLSSPLLDRIDLHIQVSRINYEKLKSKHNTESSSDIRERVIQARKIQRARLKEYGLYTNSEMSHKLIEEFCKLDTNSERLLRLAMEKFMLSIRTYDKILKIARTIADLENKENIETQHISEALQYRVLDRIMGLVA